jgi:hypothetical protein
MVAGSLTGFMSGWAILAHSPKPVSGSAQTTATQTTSGSASLPPLDLKSLSPSGSVGSNSPQTSFRNTQPSQPLQALPSSPSQSFNMPRLRSRGS